MAATAVARKANPLLNSLPLYLSRRWLGLRPTRHYSAAVSFASLSDSETSNRSVGSKVFECFKEEFEVGQSLFTLETGKIARFANGSVVMGLLGTKVHSTVVSSKGDAVQDFLPLTVEYQEKHFAKGAIPGTYGRREGPPKERELLIGRIIDRPIRPLFPHGFYHEVQVTANVLSSDMRYDPDIMAANATSAALMLSDIPWEGPIGMIRLGRIDGQFIVNPTMDELSLSDLNLIYACTRDKTLMIDVQSHGISEKDLQAGLRLAHPEAVKFIEPQMRLAAKAGKVKREYTLSMVSDKTLERVRKMAEEPIKAVFTDPSYGKFERGQALQKITQDVEKKFEEEGDEESLKVLSKAVDTVRKQVVRKRIIEKEQRLDGRQLDEVRPVYCESHYLPQIHGSSIFSRGDTQVLCTVTLGAPGEAQKLDSLVGSSTKRFMLHYSFPPYSINEVGKRVGLNRREIGHGTLAEKALLSVLPPEHEFPYTVRVTSEVMASDGSTSMATVCGASMALMDAGIAIKEHVAGISVGLVTDVDPLNGEIKDYRILTDILGLEDHLGDIDFKVAGTRRGITAIQLDMKPAGIPLDIICQCLEPACRGRHQILDHMESEINTPRPQEDRSCPLIETLKYSNDALRRLIGPLGVTKKVIEQQTGARLFVGDESLTVLAKNQAILQNVLDKIENIIGREIVIGGVYKGIVTSIREYGVFMEISGGQQGLLHVSEISHDPVTRVTDVISVGQELSLMCIDQDIRGNIKLSLKAMTSPGKKERKMSKPLVSIEDPSKTQVSQFKDLCVNSSDTRESVHSTQTSPAVMIRSVAECDEEEKSSPLNKKGTRKNHVVVNAKTLKIGMKVSATVYQVREHGLVLDLGGGIHGMLRFKENDKADFHEGEKIQVECLSFNSSGVPVTTLVKDT